MDAVEIDPFLVNIGRKYHPEHPYDSPHVSVYVDDARAFFKKTHEKYDLIIFGYLDAHTMLTGLSSIRLDNYVYTLESFREARGLLSNNGTLVMAFTGRSYLSERLYATLAEAFGTPPRAYFTNCNKTGVVYRRQRVNRHNSGYPEITSQLKSVERRRYHRDGSLALFCICNPGQSLSLSGAFLPCFFTFATTVLQREVPLRRLASRQGLHLFFLGAGFMLLETRGVTELSLLFGSHWTQ